jgi:hypothetical protein
MIKKVVVEKRILFCCLVFCLLVGCDAVRTDNVIESISRRFANVRNYEYAQVQAGSSLIQHVFALQNGTHRQSWSRLARKPEVDTSGVFLTGQNEEAIDRLRAKLFGQTSKFDSYYACNVDYQFRLAISRDIEAEPWLIEECSPSVTSIEKTRSSDLGTLVSGLSNLPEGIPRTISSRDSTSKFFPKCQEVEMVFGNEIRVRVYIDQSASAIIGSERFDKDGRITTRFVTKYYTGNGVAVPSYQVVFLADSSGELVASRCLVFKVTNVDCDFQDKFCYMSSFGFPEPPGLAKKQSVVWVLCAIFGIVVLLGVAFHRSRNRKIS